ncbi:MAG TPA: hypothetical protein VGB75_08850 [Jatrophihabitans sp.]|jgi:hypothetical protein|uniref:hypothetical protein n=1 Tax=Jatrophihabitans sp. TaxID=1932789 RepID=UPI002EFA780A
MTIAIASTSAADDVCVATAQRVGTLAAAAPAAAITPAVESAITAIEQQVPGHLIHWPDGNGGAHVFIESIDLGVPFEQSVTWVAFHVPHTVPDGDIYPVWVRPDLARIDGGPIGKTNAAGQNFMHQNQSWFTEPAVMVSLSSNGRDPNIDSPARKLARVLATVRNSG